jgi:hypothetical protein
MSSFNSNIYNPGSIQNQYVYSKTNPPYKLTTTPHSFNKSAGHSSPASLKLYERSFQGPFPSISSVNFDLQNRSQDSLLVEPLPFKGGAVKKKKKVKKSVPKRKKSVPKRKKSVPKRKKSVPKRKKSVPKRKVVKKKSFLNKFLNKNPFRKGGNKHSSK